MYAAPAWSDQLSNLNVRSSLAHLNHVAYTYTALYGEPVMTALHDRLKIQMIEL